MERFNPMREVLMEQMQGNLGQLNPAQAMLAETAGDPRAFAQLMADPQGMQAMSAASTMATPAQPESFTLGPGERRFQGSEVIAEGPQESQFPELEQITASLDRAEAERQAGNERRAEIFESRAADMAGMDRETMSSAARAVRDMGLNPAEGEGQELMRRSILGKESASAADERISALTNRGMDRQTAEDIVYGFVEREYVPELGVFRITDTLTGDTTELSQEQTSALQAEAGTAEPVVQPSEKPGEGLWQIAEAATGPLAGIRAASENALAFVGLDREGRATQARQAFRTETRNLIRALSINPRFPVAEQERIRREVGGFMPSSFRGEQLVKDRMVSLHRSLSEDIDRYVRMGRDPNSGLPDADRSAMLTAANDLSQFLDKLQVPPEALGETPRRDTEEGSNGRSERRSGASRTDVPSDQSAPGAELPEGIPQGSEYVGDNPSGNPIYRTPDGQMLVVEE
ncbi:MAG: hypothetical protein ACOC9Q_01795 [bacterium]